MHLLPTSSQVHTAVLRWQRDGLSQSAIDAKGAAYKARAKFASQLEAGRNFIRAPKKGMYSAHEQKQLVWKGVVSKTAGGLTKRQLAMNTRGKIVSRAMREAALDRST